MREENLSSLSKSEIEKINTRRGIFAVIGCLLVDLSVGEFDLLSHLYPYLTSYFYKYQEDISSDDLKFISMLWLIFQCLTLPFAIVIYSKLGFRASFAIFVTIFATSQLVCSFITEIWIFIPLYGTLCGIAQGGYVLPLYCCWRYFKPGGKAIVAGVLLSAYALAPIPTSYLALKLVNPDDIDQVVLPDGRKMFPAEVADNVPFFMRVLSAVVFTVGMTGVMMIKEPISSNEIDSSMLTINASDSYVASQDDMDEPLNNNDGTNTTVEETGRRFTFTQEVHFQESAVIEKFKLSDLKIFTNPNFLNTYFIMLVSYMYPLFMLFSFKKIAFEYGRTDFNVTVAGTIAAIFNSGSRYLSGYLFQKYGFLCIALFLLVVQVTSAMTFVFAAKSQITFIIALSGLLFNFGSLLGLYPLVSETLFNSMGAFSYSILFSSFCMSNLFILNVGEKIKDLLGNWENTMYVLGGIALLPIINIVFLDIAIRKKQRKDKAAGIEAPKFGGH